MTLRAKEVGSKFNCKVDLHDYMTMRCKLQKFKYFQTIQISNNFPIQVMLFYLKLSTAVSNFFKRFSKEKRNLLQRMKSGIYQLTSRNSGSSSLLRMFGLKSEVIQLLGATCQQIKWTQVGIVTLYSYEKLNQL